MINSDNMRIDLSDIDEDSFELDYKSCVQELYSERLSGDDSCAIEILFDEEGEFKGHIWENNKSYILSDLRKMHLFKLSPEDLESISEKLKEWEQEEYDYMCEQAAFCRCIYNLKTRQTSLYWGGLGGVPSLSDARITDILEKGSTLEDLIVYDIQADGVCCPSNFTDYEVEYIKELIDEALNNARG